MRHFSFCLMLVLTLLLMANVSQGLPRVDFVVTMARYYGIILVIFTIINNYIVLICRSMQAENMRVLNRQATLAITKESRLLDEIVSGQVAIAKKGY